MYRWFRIKCSSILWTQPIDCKREPIPWGRIEHVTKIIYRQVDFCEFHLYFYKKYVLPQYPYSVRVTLFVIFLSRQMFQAHWYLRMLPCKFESESSYIGWEPVNEYSHIPRAFFIGLSGSSIFHSVIVFPNSLCWINFSRFNFNQCEKMNLSPPSGKLY